MFVEWLRKNVFASVLLLFARLYLGWEWMSAGWGKITGEGFSAGKFLEKAVANPVVSHDEIIYPTYTAFLKSFALPNVDLINFMIPYGEFLVGLGLILGCLTTAAGFFGVVMNFAFLYAGTVSSNPWMIMLTLFILISGRNAGYFGLDRYLYPYYDRMFHRTPPKTPVTPIHKKIA
ncbi:MAG TPA: DoxX family protein [Candidatus Bathyarchaeia archaeon]|nr:DoxX family protein [Candidatus Bathyarchaeia archaeon]